MQFVDYSLFLFVKHYSAITLLNCKGYLGLYSYVAVKYM